MKKDYSLPLYLFHDGTNMQCYDFFSPKKVKVKNKEAWTFRVWAPNAKEVSLVGDFNSWDVKKTPMEIIADGIYEVTVPGLKVYDIYKFAVTTQDGNVVFKSDPFALHAETAPANASKLYDIEGYKWGDAEWLKERTNRNAIDAPINIYELQLGSWKRNKDGSVLSYRKLAKKIVEYVKSMNYTHIEIMPITEYPFDGSWGYQVTGFFAPTSRFGTPTDFMYFVDLCHQNGIGVILDWVIAHFPKDEHGLYRFDGTPLYEYSPATRTEHPEWGTVEFDMGKKEVHSFLISSANFWLEKYHIDGIRVDAVASMLYLNYGREEGEWKKNKYGSNHNLESIEFLQSLNTKILTKHPDVIMIAEESTAFPMVTMPSYDGGLGFNYKWNMGWMNDLLSYTSADPFFRKDMHNKLTFAITYAYSENYILPLSHDEVVHGKASLLNKMPGYYDDKFRALAAFYAFMYAHPGKKLLFMGGEFGQFIEWDFQKELDWFLLDYPSHKKLHKYVKDLNKVYKEEPALYELDNLYDGFKWIVVDDNTQNIVSFIRYAKDKKDYVIAIVNFAPIERKGYQMGVPEKRVLREILNSDLEKYGGKTIKGQRYTPEKKPMHSHQYSITLDIPANGAIYLKKIRK